MEHRNSHPREMRRSERVWAYAALLVMLVLVLAAPLGLAMAQEAPAGAAVEYRDVPGIGSRNLIWIVAQQHLLLAGFVLGVPIFAWVCEIVGVRTKDPRYDKLAKEFTKLLTSAYATTALFGGILLFLLIGLYPKLMNYLTDVFFPSFLVYSALFLLETATLYLYWYGWDAMQGRKKGMHLFLGFLLNVFALFIMIVPNSWATFQTSPVVITESSMWAKAWAATWNPTWWPLNVHRLIANVVLGGFLCGAYAGLKYLMTTSQEERVHYDWMGYVGNFIGVFGMLPLPFAGYWLMREVYQYNQQMGITLMGGLLAWLFIIQAVMIGALFLTANYYLWQGMERMRGAERYQKYIKYMVFVLITCFIVWLTPHTIVMTPAELKAMGGQQHPVLGNYGVMSAKNGAINTIITTTVLSFIMYQRANKIPTVRWAPLGNAFLVGLFTMAYINIIWLAIYGYYIPANVRVGLSVPQVASTLSCLFIGVILNSFMLRGAKDTGPIAWGQISVRSQYALIMLATAFTWMMGLMGYIRSSVRLFWHVNEIMRDNSPWAFTHTIGFGANMISFNVLFFWVTILFVFWLGSLGIKKAPVTVPAGQKVPLPASSH